MAELPDRLSGAVDGTKPRWSSAEDVRRASQRRRMRSRLLAGGVAVAVAIAGVAVTLNALRTVDASDQPRSGAALDVAALEYAWTADMSVADPVSLEIMPPMGVDATSVYVADDRGVTAYPKGCTDPCAALWHGVAESSEPREIQMAVGDGVVFVSSERSLVAFDANCAADGSTCAPKWRAEFPSAVTLVGLQASGRNARVMYSLGGNENRNGVNAAIFSADACDDAAPCEPIATVALGPGTMSTPGSVIDGVFYQHVGTTLTGIRPGPCGRPVCEPSFVVQASAGELAAAGEYLAPVGFGDAVVVSLGGEVRAYPRNCSPSCSPLWIGDAGESIEGQEPVVSGGTVAVTAGKRVVAFGPGCPSDGSACRPAWVGVVEERGSLSGDDSGIVLDPYREGSIAAFAPGCRGACRPAWVVDPKGATSLWAIAEGHAFVQIGERLGAYPMGCEGFCEPVWSERFDRSLREVIADASGVYVQVGGTEPKVVAYRSARSVLDTEPRPEQPEPSEPPVDASSSDAAPAPPITTPPDDRTTNVTVKGVGVSFRLDWTLIQLDDPDPGGAGPILQLTNFHVPLSGSLCPGELAVPPGGVGLFVQRTEGVDPASVPAWPVEPIVSEPPTGPCGDASSLEWGAGNVTFAATMFASADATREDRDRLVEAFQGLSFDRFARVSRDASTIDEMFEGPSFVTGLPPNAFGAEFVVLIPEDGDPATMQLGTTSMGGIGYSIFEPEPGDVFMPGGDSGTPIDGAEGEYDVKAIGYADSSVDRVVLVADDGRRIEAALGPSLERYGVNWRLVYVEFRSPLVGDWTVIKDGEVIATVRYANWPAR